ncbi:uncharacterized protein [Onthophagus taurus]|uniref:uncharacterized protein n=1 Tax=Onthophagus taurus TaxID=166361 RepID=UPI0039BE524C
MEEIHNTFGPPTRLVSDRGTAFTSKKFTEYCKMNQIIHIQNTTATPRANGQVERYNRTLMTAIFTRSENEDGRDWDKRLCEIQFAVNSLPNSVTKKTPHELLFAYRPRNALQNHLLLALTEDEAVSEKEITEIRTDALHVIRKRHKDQKERFDKLRIKLRKYQEGDLVLVKCEATATGESRKLALRYKGPYVIHKVLPNDRYELKDIPGAPRSQKPYHSVFASDRMKPWCVITDLDGEEDESTDSEEEMNSEDGEVRAEDDPNGSKAECEDRYR